MLNGTRPKKGFFTGNLFDEEIGEIGLPDQKVQSKGIGQLDMIVWVTNIIYLFHCSKKVEIYNITA